ncbi:MAG TPA: DNA repair protein RecN [bacterium]
MLAELFVKNFAIINELALTLERGFNAFTGETGAGKSIIVDALEMTVGGRADADVVRTGCEEAEVTARFDLSGHPEIIGMLKDRGISSGGEVIFRRVITNAGKSRSYINEKICTLGLLKDIGEKVLDIHGQHQHQSLLHIETHIDYLDRFGGLIKMREELAGMYYNWKSIREKIDLLKEQEKQKAEKEDFLRFQLKEIADANLKQDEETALKEERQILLNAERLSNFVHDGFDKIYSGEGSVIETLSAFGKKLTDISKIDSSFSSLDPLIADCLMQLEEVSSFLRGYDEKLNFHPSRLEDIDERLTLINRLKKKYGDSVEDVIGKLEKFKIELDGLETVSESLKKLEAEDAAAFEKLIKASAEISNLRVKAAKNFKKKIEAELHNLGMDKARLEISFIKTEMTPFGIDGVEFLIAPNQGEDMRPLVKIASGGELSRIMLALRRVLSGFSGVPVLVFDEIDSGIGGSVADSVGRNLKMIAREHQVLCVTHLPQIACYADNHYTVWKTGESNRTVTRVKLMTKSERIDELAKMAGGLLLTPKSREYARELLERAG